jgi:hypothetical protein
MTTQFVRKSQKSFNHRGKEYGTGEVSGEASPTIKLLPKRVNTANF